MRLIDADALKEEVKTIFCPDGYKIMMLERIDNAPTALFPLTAIINDKVTDEDIEKLKQLMKDYKPQVLNLETKRPQVKCENCDLYFKAMTKEEQKHDV